MIGRQYQIDLFKTAGIELEVLFRSNQKELMPITWIFEKKYGR